MKEVAKPEHIKGSKEKEEVAKRGRSSRPEPGPNNTFQQYLLMVNSFLSFAEYITNHTTFTLVLHLLACHFAQ